MDNVYVVDFGNFPNQKFDKNGNYLLQWGAYGRGDGQFWCPSGISIDKNDNVYVSEGSFEYWYEDPARVQ
ncbi:MAG: hypothetical protein M0C28_01575 [Candidatus Moduliflexus flocculans]|nr:hypothetical protein [Candidatus Moduliflexus flocculans]